MTTAAPAQDAAEREAAEKLLPLLDNPVWRMSNLYKIIAKDERDDSDEGLVIQFIPNRAQLRLLRRMHSRNIVLKARQLGYSTLAALLWLDTALFSKDPIRCGIIAHEREAAESIFRDKVVFAYDNLPEALRAAMPLASKNKTEIVFGHNGASIRVATSMRSGTIHRLHVSELGKIARKYPEKAREVISGSIPTVPSSGIIIIIPWFFFLSRNKDESVGQFGRPIGNGGTCCCCCRATTTTKVVPKQRQQQQQQQQQEQ